MKRNFYLLFLAFLFGCQEPIATKKEVYSFLFDATESHIQRPNKEELLRFISYQKRDKFTHIRMSKLSSVDYNTVQEFILPKENTGLFANALEEKKSMRKFKRELFQYLDAKDTVIADYRESSIFDPMIQELNYLSNLKGYNNKVLVINSDLMENNSWSSFYRKSDLRLLHYKRKKLVKRFLKRIDTTQDFTKISVHVYYLPQNTKDNNRFKHLRMLYTDIFNALDIPIVFAANLNKASIPDEFSN